ncbi:hypothetical protein K449DRAFT_401380 [Hypoxylon sp. EC38]|nr:hypothetical protein K449DRAFT_401380 [Hypoxylon sp. EC38]
MLGNRKFTIHKKAVRVALTVRAWNKRSSDDISSMHCLHNENEKAQEYSEDSEDHATRYVFKNRHNTSVNLGELLKTPAPAHRYRKIKNAILLEQNCRSLLANNACVEIDNYPLAVNLGFGARGRTRRTIVLRSNCPRRVGAPKLYYHDMMAEKICPIIPNGL